MTTRYVADTGVFVRCGGPSSAKFQRLRRALLTADEQLLIPRRVYEELGGDPAADEYPSGSIPYTNGIEEGWIVVAEELDHTDSAVSTVMDEARRFIATETDRDEDSVEKTDTALLGLAVQLLAGEVENVVLLTTDKPAGQAAERLLPKHGFGDRIDYRYASEEFLATITAREFR